MIETTPLAWYKIQLIGKQNAFEYSTDSIIDDNYILKQFKLTP